jgi:large subunit ribosomal protein L35
MPKMKSHKGTRKRIRVSAGGKVTYKQPNAGHLMSAKSGKRRRRLRRPGQLRGVFQTRLRTSLAGGKA